MNPFAEIGRLFFYAGWRRQCLTMFAILLGVVAENLSIASLWPIIGVVSGSGPKQASATEIVTGLLGLFNLSPTLGVLLLFLTIALTIKFVLTAGGLMY